MAVVTTFTFTSDTETVTKTKLNNLVANLKTEFNGNIDNDNIKAGAAIAISKLATSGTLTLTKLQIDDTNTSIDEDASGNLIFTDAVSGSRTLAQLISTAGTGASYITTFTSTDLTAGVLTVNHNLNQLTVNVGVYNGSNQQVTPDQVTLVTINQCTVDISSWGDISGQTWRIICTA